MEIQEYNLLNIREKSKYRKQVYLETGMLYCGNCGKIKDISLFRDNHSGYLGKYSICVKCARTKDINYKKKHIMEKLEYDKVYYQKTKVKRKVDGQIYRSHPETKETRRIRANKKYKINEQYRQSVMLRLTISRAFNKYIKIGNYRDYKVEELLGCTIKEFIEYIESGFRGNMSLDNYGVLWNFDHKIPCNSYDLTDKTQQKLCFNYTNYQPLTLLENSQKGINRTIEGAWT